MLMPSMRKNVYQSTLAVLLLLASACAQATPAPTAVPPTTALTPSVPLSAAPTTAPTVPPTEPATTAPTAAPTTAPTEPPTAAATAASTTAALSGQVSWMVLADPEQLKAFQAVADAFQIKYPGVKVNLSSAADNEEDYHAALGTALAGGSPPDVANLDYDATSQYAATGALLPLAGDIVHSTLIHATDFYTQAWIGFQWQAQQICLPISVSGLMVFYNKKLFDEAKLAYPTAGWTWDEFLADARALTKGTDQYGVTVEPEFNNLLPFVWQNGGDLMSADGKKLALDAPPATAAMQFFVDLQSKYHVTPDQTAAASQEPPDRFIGGTLGMMINNRAAVPSLRVITDFDWDVAPLPKKTQAANILKADGLCLPAKAKSPDLAWKLIEFAASPEGQTLLSAAGHIVPSNIAVSRSPAFLDPSAKPANSQAWLDEIANIRIVPALAHWPDIEEAGNAELANAFYGHATAATAIQSIIDKTQRFLAP
jgi:multiple sugar transport system substrate-binding protein